jgi:choline dehydrogenase-like flavoprotein
MIRDVRTLEAGSVLRSRVCVIGTGMGGSAVAQKLAASGHQVLLVEAGSLEPRLGDSDTVATEFVGRPFNRPPTRCLELGGTSNQWHGICGPLDEVDFEHRPWIPYSGWPLRRRDLQPFYAEAASLLGLGEDAPFEPDLQEPQVRERLRDFDFNRTTLENKVVRYRNPPTRWKSALLARATAGQFDCLINAPALELVANEDGSAIERLVVGAGRATISVLADTFVVCAGTLETPRLLLNSRRRLPAGVGNGHDLVGRFLLDHPTGHFCKLGFHRPTPARIYASIPVGHQTRLMAGLIVSGEVQRRQRIPNHCLWIRPSVTVARIDDDLLRSFLAVRGVRDLTLRQIKGMVANPDILYRILVHRFGMHPRFRYADLYYFTEQLPNPNSRVTLSDRRLDRYGYPIARADWQLTDDDFRAFQSYTGVLFGQGLRSPQYTMARTDDLSLWIQNVASAAHHVGTARMADHPRRGVVDANQQVFGISNLFVGDGSVFPTAGSTNPSLTITALALRLADHLIARQRPIAVRELVTAD